MLNLIASNVSEQVLPIQIPASFGLRYLRRRVERGELPPPQVDRLRLLLAACAL